MHLWAVKRSLSSIPRCAVTTGVDSGDAVCTINGQKVIQIGLIKPNEHEKAISISV